MTKITAHLKWLVVTFVLQASVFAAPAKPNVILIVTDDQGYADVGCYGGEGVETPNLDRLAAQGARFTDYYAANSVCSPSRASILTGRYPTKSGVPEVLGPGAEKYLKGVQLGLPPGETTVAELLKQAGYTTACIGKWHLGHLEEYLPTNHGFDYFFGQPYSNDMPIDAVHAKLAEDIILNNGATRESIRAGKHAKKYTNPSGLATDNPEEFHTPLMIGDEVVEFPVDQETLTQRYTDEAIAFINRSEGKPFFLYLAHTMPHVPLAATEAFRGRKTRASYADTIKELDYNIGRLLTHLEETRAAENTLVMFTSDNGPLGHPPGFGGSAHPLKGFKFHTHEGGHRVPFIVRWPDEVPAGEVIPEVTSALDILPTITAAANIPTPDNIDGTSLLPLLEGKEGQGFDERPFFYIRGLEIQAVRLGDWKLQMATEGTPFRLRIPEVPQPRLYNLREDPSESRNLAADNPDLVGKLRRLVEEAQAELGSAAHNHLTKYLRPHTSFYGPLMKSQQHVWGNADFDSIFARPESRTRVNPLDCETPKRPAFQTRPCTSQQPRTRGGGTSCIQGLEPLFPRFTACLHSCLINDGRMNPAREATTVCMRLTPCGQHSMKLVS